MSEVWRRGSKVGRTLYCDDRLVGLVDTSEIAEQVCKAMNARGENWDLYQVAQEALKFASPLTAWNSDGSPQNAAAKLVVELRDALDASFKKV